MPKCSNLQPPKFSTMNLPNECDFKEEVLLGLTVPAFETMRTTGEFTDMLIQSKEGKKINVHKMILAVRIPSLEDTLSAMESNTLVWNQFDSEVTFEQLYPKWVLACETKSQRLLATCVDVMKANFARLVDSDWFHEIPADTLKALLADRLLNFESEHFKCLGALKWLKSDRDAEEVDDRSSHFRSLMNEIEWTSVSREFTETVLLSNDSTHITNADDRSYLGALLKAERQVIFAVGKDPNSKNKNALIMLDPSYNHEVLYGTPVYRDLCAIVSLKDGVYMIGGGLYGMDGFVEGTNTVEVFKFKTRTISYTPPMKHSRSAPAAAASTTEIAVCGGWSNNTCEVYQLSTGRWKDLPSLKENRSDFSVVWLPDGQIIAMGGYNVEHGALASVEVLKKPCDSIESPMEWREIAPMTCKRVSHVATVLSGERVFVVGGSTSVEALTPPRNDTDLGQWTTITQLTTAPTLCGIIQTEGGFFFFSSRETYFMDSKQMDLKKHRDDNNEGGWIWQPRKLTLMEHIWGATSQLLSFTELQEPCARQKDNL